MKQTEKFNPSKFFDMSPSAMYKVFGLGLKVLVIALIIMGVLWVKAILFPPAPSNMNQPTFHVAEGGAVSYNVVQQSQKKRAWFIPTPYVELFGQVTTRRQTPEAVGRIGVKWEF